MTICFFKFPLQNSLGGAEQQTLRLAEHFRALGHEIKLYTSDGKLFRLFEKHRLPRRRIFAGWEPTSKWALAFWPLTVCLARKKFQKLLKYAPAGSVFLFQSLTEKLLLTAAAQKKGIKVFWWEHKVPGRWLKASPLLPLYKNRAKQTASIITVSQYARKAFLDLGLAAEKIRLVYPGVEIPPNLRRPAAKPFTIGLLSRLDPEKGVLGFLRAGKKFWGAHPNWQILIAGSGSQDAEIRSFAQSQDWTNQIILLGFINSLDDFFSKISVLVLPSLVPESFGLAAAEALARGVPVVAFDQGAVSEIVTHKKTGYLAKPNDFFAMSGYLDALSNQTTWQQIAEAAFLNRERFALAKMFQTFDRIILF